MSGEPVHGGYTADELQAQYSARTAVPEHPEIFARWQEQSAAWRAEAGAAGRTRLGVAYGRHARERLDLFLPAAPAEAAPLHVFLHGGYWQSMQPEDFGFVARSLNAVGFAVAVVGYPLCPEVKLEAIPQAIARAMDWLGANADALGLAADRVHVAGHSAGGHLAVAAATRHASDTSLGIAGIAPVSGVFDLEPLVHTRINEALALDAETARCLSVHDVAVPSGVRLDAFVGGAESAEFRRQSRALATRWGEENGAAARFHPMEGHNHFTILDALYAPEGPMVTAARLAAG